MAFGTGRTRLLAFKTELDRLMIAYRIEGGQLLWNDADVQARDQMVRWAETYDKTQPAAFPPRSRRDTTIIEPADVTARSEVIDERTT